jgi:phosphate-selective porin
LVIPSAELQIRDTTNWNTAGDDSIENGFDIRRFKIRLEGNAINKDLTFAFQYATSNSTGTPNLEDAWAKYQWQPGWYVRGGQFKDPLLHEQLVSGRRQLTADRTLLSLAMTGTSDNYIQGVSVIYDAKDQPWRAEAAFTDGISSSDTTWRDFPSNSTDWGAAGRVEYFAMGDRAQYDDFTALGNKKDLLVFGLAGDITQAGSDSVYLHTIDAQWENTDGLSAYGAYVGRYVDASGGEAYDYGLEVQGAYLFKPQWEAFVRYDFIKLDNDVTFASGGSEDLFHEFTVGVNYYLKAHYAKFTLDASYLPNGAPSDQIGLGELGGDDAQFTLRGQFQLVL